MSGAARRSVGDFIAFKEVMRMVLFTFFCLVFLRVLSFVTMPGLAIKKGWNEAAGDFFYLISILGGNLMSRFSIIALGVAPYITASVIVQLLCSGLIPAMSEWRKYG